MIPQFKAAMFDMDGTVLCSMRYWRLATVELLLSYNIVPSPDQMSRVFSSSSRALCLEVFAEHGIIKDQWTVLHELEHIMQHHYQHDVTPKPHVAQYLRSLKSAGIPLCIATASPKQLAVDVLRRLDLADYFDFITDCEEQQMRKDDPLFFHRIAKQLNVQAEEMCVFEDSLYAVRSAKSVPCPVIAILDPMQAHDFAAIRSLADHCVSDYQELL